MWTRTTPARNRLRRFFLVIISPRIRYMFARWPLLVLCASLQCTASIRAHVSALPSSLRTPLRAVTSCDTSRRHMNPRCDLSDEEVSLDALRAELRKREPSSDLGRSHALLSQGPHHTTTPKEVVEHVVTQLCQGNVEQAFTFTCVPVTKRGTHKSSTDWTQRMAWEKCQVINGAPSGRYLDSSGFENMVQTRYPALLDTESFRFVGDTSSWQQKNGQARARALAWARARNRAWPAPSLLLRTRKLIVRGLDACHRRR